MFVTGAGGIRGSRELCLWDDGRLSVFVTGAGAGSCVCEMMVSYLCLLQERGQGAVSVRWRSAICVCYRCGGRELCLWDDGRLSVFVTGTGGIRRSRELCLRDDGRWGAPEPQGVAAWQDDGHSGRLALHPRPHVCRSATRCQRRSQRLVSNALTDLEGRFGPSGRIFTTRKRNLVQGNVFTPVCQSFCSCVGWGGSLWCHFPSGYLIPCSFGGGSLCLVPCLRFTHRRPPSMVDKRAVRILLECCLITLWYSVQCKQYCGVSFIR